MITEEQILARQLQALLTYAPYKHIVGKVLKRKKDVPQYEKFGFRSDSKLQKGLFLSLDNHQIEKINLIADVELYNRIGNRIDFLISELNLEFYLVMDIKDDRIDRGLILDLDDLLFYLNNYQNEIAKKENDFPSFSPCELVPPAFNFIERGRIFRNQYFDAYHGPVFDLWYRDEFVELFAISSNALAFLYRIRDRVMEEVDLFENNYYESQMNIYPRFNNAIAEVAGSIYSIWERIAFILNEFFPLQPNAQMAPSFKKYITKKVKESQTTISLSNEHLDWFNQRLKKEHQRLEDLRHPTIHYNKHRNPAGTRSVELMKSRLDHGGIILLKQTWNDELTFLKNELHIVSEGLEHGINLLESFATVVAMPV